MRPDFFCCYEPQRRAVEEFLRPLMSAPQAAGPSRPRVHAVSDYYQLQGHEDVTFIVIIGHPRPVPDSIYHALRNYGATLWNLDDSWRRDSYNRSQLERKAK